MTLAITFLLGALWGLQVASYAASLPDPLPGKAGAFLARLGRNWSKP